MVGGRGRAVFCLLVMVLFPDNFLDLDASLAALDLGADCW